MVKMKAKFFSWILFFYILCFSCNKGPKVIQLEEDIIVPSFSSEIHSENYESSGVFNEDDVIDHYLHNVVVKEVLPTDKYIYVKVGEKDSTYWIATLKTEVEIGGSYYYKGSVLQSNFKSKEYNRIFEEVYFVSELIPSEHGASYEASMKESGGGIMSAKEGIEPRDVRIEGSVRIAELVANPEKYGGETIRVSGVCIKINNEIMGRNWVHLRDGSKDDFDLVVTTNDEVEVGQIVTLEGIVGLDRDFGAGYQYNIIIEAAELMVM